MDRNAGNETGKTLKSGNFMLIGQIKDLNELYMYLQGTPSVYFAQKMYPSAWIMSLQLRYVKQRIDQGLFWATLDLRPAKKHIAGTCKKKDCNKPEYEFGMCYKHYILTEEV